MKTLVKYLPADKLLSARCGNKRRLLSVSQLQTIGAGDNTVQEDGKTVHIVKAQFDRIVP